MQGSLVVRMRCDGPRSCGESSPTCSGAGGAVGGGFAPSDQAGAVHEQLTGEIEVLHSRFEQLIDREVPGFNELLRTRDPRALAVPARSVVR